VNILAVKLRRKRLICLPL